MNLFLRHGVVCVEQDGSTIILDTGSPVSLGDGSTYSIEGIDCKTQESLLLYSWEKVKESIPFEVAALIGTDQLAQSPFNLNFGDALFEWIPPLINGSAFTRIMGVPVVDVSCNGKVEKFFLDTGASITYVVDESLLLGLEKFDDVEDFHPFTGKFTTPVYRAEVVFDGVQVVSTVGVLPGLLAMSMIPLGLTGIVGTDTLRQGSLAIDLDNQRVQFNKSVNQSIPHDSWAGEYDTLFDASFGMLLEQLTDLTLEKIASCVSPPANILDVGAGTGRLSIPLLDRGYSVTAVDPSIAMLNQLSQKPGGELVTCYGVRVDELSSSEPFDLAVCVFTVSSYWISEDLLRSSLKSICDHLKPRGSLIIDRTSEYAFTGTTIDTEEISRRATVDHVEDNLYRFSENSTVQTDQGSKVVSDSFDIRYWTEQELFSAAEDVGFVLKEDLSNQFRGSGSSFYHFKKAE